MTDSTRKLDRRGLRALEQLETESLLAKVDNLACQGRGIGLRECQDPIQIVSLAAVPLLCPRSRRTESVLCGW
jgi:hypothetical protein